MEVYCKSCGHWRMEISYHDRTKPDFKFVCRECGDFWFEKENPFKKEAKVMGSGNAQVFGFQLPPSNYYLHRGHAWAALEDSGQVRVGLDDFSQKILGPSQELKLPAVGMAYYQDHICMALVREGNRASFEAPVDGIITTVNPKVRQNPALIHDDPYGEGWVLKVKPTNFKQNLDNLFSTAGHAVWIDHESHRLLHLMDATAGVTLPDGGAIVDDVYGHFPQLGWRRLVKEFFLINLTREWRKRA